MNELTPMKLNEDFWESPERFKVYEAEYDDFLFRIVFSPLVGLYIDVLNSEERYNIVHDATYEVLKAWNLGYTGGITTIHANCTQSMLSRIRYLLREAIPGELPDVAQSVQLLVHMKRTKNGPVVSEVVETKQIPGSGWE